MTFIVIRNRKTMTNIKDLFQELYETNKYLIKIYNTIDNKWVIYMYKNKHIQLYIEDEKSLNSSYINIDDIIDYINNQISSIKICYTCYDDDFEEYNLKIKNILHNIKEYYTKYDKTIIIKYKLYYI